MISRRDMLRQTGLGAAALAFGATARAADGKGPFTLPKLPYAYDALEPHIDAVTMETHHSKHHQAYVDNLNKAVAGTDWADKTVEEILRHLNSVPAAKQAAVRNNGGGHFNHTLFWEVMSKDGGKPTGELAKAIDAAFGGLDPLFAKMKEAAMTQFGSGWAWLCVSPKAKGGLAVIKTANQNNPIMQDSAITDGAGEPILGVDVWEHAYYLKYKNKRADYVDAWFKVINWKAVADRYSHARKA